MVPLRDGVVTVVCSKSPKWLRFFDVLPWGFDSIWHYVAAESWRTL
jgi:hypothetical protein